MSTETHTPNAPPQLRSNSLGLSELVFQAVTHIAPASNVIFAFPIIALKAGPVMPISLLLATIVCLFIGNTVSQFSSYIPSSGGYYSFATRGLGSRAGFMATWSYLAYEIPGNAGLTGFLGYFVSDMLHTEFNLNIPWYLISLATIALVWALTYRGIQLSARVTAILGGVEILIMLAMSLTFLIHPGKGSSYTAPLNPLNAPNHFGGVLAGMVFSVLALSGFEAPAPMAQEAKRPASFIAKAITLSLLTIGGFYIFTSYAAAIGWGTGDMAAFASSANPYYTLGHAFWGIGWWAVVLALVNSAVGVGLAATNATSRVMYTMGRAGTLPQNSRASIPCIKLRRTRSASSSSPAPSQSSSSASCSNPTPSSAFSKPSPPSPSSSSTSCPTSRSPVTCAASSRNIFPSGNTASSHGSPRSACFPFYSSRFIRSPLGLTTSRPTFSPSLSSSASSI